MVITEGLVQHMPMGQWLADMYFVGFSPALTLLLCDRNSPANRQMPIGSVDMVNRKKKTTH
jgi:hypothetical protein